MRATRSTPSRAGSAVVLGLAVTLVAGCGSSSGGTGSTSASTPATTESAAMASDAPAMVATTPAATTSPDAAGVDLLLKISVNGKTIEPKPSRHTVKTGGTVRLVLTTDTANVVHVHGVDIERPVSAGVPVTIDFKADQPGVYPIELHEPELLIAQLVVR